MARVLISSVACDPRGGSEGAVGWNAVRLIAKRHDLVVLTHAKYKASWAQATSAGEVPDNVRVEFLGTRKEWHRNRMIARIQSWKWYVDFSRHALQRAREIISSGQIDLVHQVTYATWRVPSRLWTLGKPFVWGPVGGAAEIPVNFLPMLGTGSRVVEALRGWQTRIMVRSKAFLDCIENSKVVLAANEETMEFLAKFREGKPMLQLPVAYLSPEKVQRFRRSSMCSASDRPLRLFAGGNMEGRKGVALALRALAMVREKGYLFHYTIAGGGPDIPRLRRMVFRLGLADCVEFHPGFHAEEYVRKLQETDIYLLPSFRETTPVTLQEAILAGCFPVVADASAAGEMARKAGGKVLTPTSPDEFVVALASALRDSFENRANLFDLGVQCAQRVTEAYSASNYEATMQEAYLLALRAVRT